jgi:hypothetical protein
MNENEAMVALVVGLAESAFGEVWSQTVGFVLVRLAGIWL